MNAQQFRSIFFAAPALLAGACLRYEAPLPETAAEPEPAAVRVTSEAISGAEATRILDVLHGFAVDAPRPLAALATDCRLKHPAITAELAPRVMRPLLDRGLVARDGSIAPHVCGVVNAFVEVNSNDMGIIDARVHTPARIN